MARSTKRPLIAVLLVLGALATASVGSAASLTITGGSLGTHAAGHPCPGTLAATTDPTSIPVSTVTITPPAACVDRTVTVAVNDGVNVRQGTATAPASGSVTVGLDGSYSPSATTQVAAVVSGWYLATGWTYTPPVIPPGPIVPGNANTVILPIIWTQPAQNQVCALVTVTTNTQEKSPWLVNLNVAQPPFNGATSGYQITTGQAEFTPSGTAQNGVLSIKGGNNGWDTLAQGTDRSFTVCHYGLPIPPDTPSAYTYVTSNGTWTDTEACVVATITGNGSSSFYFGWAVPVNMTPAFQRIQSAGYTVSRLALFPGSSTVASVSPALSPGTSAYVVRSEWQGVLRQSESLAVTVCAYRY